MTRTPVPVKPPGVRSRLRSVTAEQSVRHPERVRPPWPLGAQPAGLGAGLDDVRVEGDPVSDCGDQPLVAEHAAQSSERKVGPDPDQGVFVPLGDDLEQQFGAAGSICT
jgi:hypothetical protein